LPVSVISERYALLEILKDAEDVAIQFKVLKRSFLIVFGVISQIMSYEGCSLKVCYVIPMVFGKAFLPVPMHYTLCCQVMLLYKSG
jgi:hypothetical protein